MKAISPAQSDILLRAHGAGASNREIGRLLGINHHTVARHLDSRGLQTNNPRRIDATTRFWSFVDKGSSCWTWTGGRNADGYGAFKANGRQVRAHRFSYKLHFPDRMLGDRDFVCHRCDNPPCVRPDHLFVGTPSDNTRDMLRKGRAAGVHTAPREGQRKGAATRTQRTLTETLPGVLSEICIRSERGDSVTFRACMSIKGYHAVRSRFNHSEILEMARCGL